MRNGERKGRTCDGEGGGGGGGGRGRWGGGGVQAFVKECMIHTFPFSLTGD